MNLPSFLNKVDALTAKLSHKDLEDSLHAIARTYPESQREYFLDVLEIFGGKDVSEKVGKEDWHDSLQADVEAMKKKLKEINDGVRCLDSKYNEEWDDWYNSGVDEILLTDSEGVLDDIDKAMELVHRLVDMKAYKEGCELAEMLSFLDVKAVGDYNDYDGSPINIRELNDRQLLSHDFKMMARECLYLAYMENSR